MSQENRVETMAVKLAAYARRAGVPPAAIVQAYEHSVALRRRILESVFHPQLLHPARTVLILLQDTEVRDPALLAAAALVESEDARLRPDGAVLRRLFGEGVAQLADAVPAAEDEALTEKLVTLPNDVATVALAERLDHARHLKFREPGCWLARYTQIERVYLPACARINEPLTRRYERWALGFRKQQLERA